MKNNEFEYESVEREWYNKWVFVNVKRKAGKEWIVIAAVHFYSKQGRKHLTYAHMEFIENF